MSGTALDHQLIRDYLRELDAATRGLPRAHARELREQIAAHLDEALPPDASDDDVEAALARLGAPDALAAEASATSAAGQAPPSGWRAVSALLARLRPRTWIAAGVLAVAVIAGARIADHYLSAPPLQYNNGGDWWYQQDAKHEQVARTWTSTQNTAPLRLGQHQGYVVSVYNSSDVTETVVGDATGPYGWNNPGARAEQLTASSSYTDIANGVVGSTAAAHLKFGLPVSIPPFQARLVRVLWTSRLCLTPGESYGITTLALRVRTGWFTRTQMIPQQGWYLIGPKGSHCPH